MDKQSTPTIEPTGLFKEWQREFEYKDGYNTANVIINALGLDAAKETQGKLHDMGISDTEITGFTQAIIDHVLRTV